MNIKSLNIIESGIHKSLGELEAQIMNALWKSSDPLSARDITTTINKKKSISFNAVTAVLNRLEKKELVERIAKGKRYSFSPAMSKQRYSRMILLSGMHSLFSDTSLLSAAGFSGDSEGIALKQAQDAIETLEQFLNNPTSHET